MLFSSPLTFGVGYSEEANLLLLGVFLPLLLCVPSGSIHTEDLNELFVRQIVLLLCASDTFGEACLEYLVGELVGVWIKLAGEWITGCSLSSFCLFGLLLSCCCHDFWISLKPLFSNFWLPLNKLNSKCGRFTASKHLFDQCIFFDTLILDLCNVLFSTLYGSSTLKLVGFVSNPDEDGAIGIQDVAVVIEQIFLSKGWNLFHPHISRSI